MWLLSLAIGLSTPCSTLSLPLFDLSPQIGAFNKINQLPDSTPSFDTVTTLRAFEQICQTLPPVSSPEEQAFVLLSAQQAMIYLLIQEISRIKRYQAYWQEQLHRPFAYFLSKPPHKWFKGKPQKQDLEDTLKILSIIEDNIAEHIGMLKNNIDEYVHVQTQTDLQDIIEQQQAFLVALFGNTLQPDFNANIALLGSGFVHYYQTMGDLIKPHKRANHFSRNWIAYTTTGLCLVTAACWYFKNPDTNKAWIQQIYTENKNALRHMKQRVFEQITDIKNKWFSPAPPPINTSMLEADDMTIARSNFLAVETYVNILRENKKMPADLEQKYQELLKNQTIENMQKFSNEHMATLLAYSIKATSEQNVFSKTSSLIHLSNNGFIPHALAKGYQLFKEVLAPLIQRTDQTAQKVELIMPLVVLTPVVLFTYLSMSALKFSYNKLAPHKVAHKGILTTLLQVEELLNDNAHKNELEIKDLGQLTYHLGMLCTYAQDLSLQEHYDFCKDLHKLFSASRSIPQKLKDIDIIRKKYQFLA